MQSNFERRLKRFYLSEDKLIRMFNTWVEPGLYMQLPITDKLPEGSVVKSVQYDACHQALCIIVYHDDFPIVPDCEIIPECVDTFEVLVVSIEQLLKDRGFKVEPLATRML